MGWILTEERINRKNIKNFLRVKLFYIKLQRYTYHYALVKNLWDPQHKK